MTINAKFMITQAHTLPETHPTIGHTVHLESVDQGLVASMDLILPREAKLPEVGSHVFIVMDSQPLNTDREAVIAELNAKIDELQQQLSPKSTDPFPEVSRESNAQ